MKRQTNVWEEVNEKDMGSRDKTCEKQVTKSTILMHLSFAEFAKSIYMKVNILYRIFFFFFFFFFFFKWKYSMENRIRVYTTLDQSYSQKFTNNFVSSTRKKNKIKKKNP
jgi:hypothetical protein